MAVIAPRLGQNPSLLAWKVDSDTTPLSALGHRYELRATARRMRSCGAKDISFLYKADHAPWTSVRLRGVMN